MLKFRFRLHLILIYIINLFDDFHTAFANTGVERWDYVTVRPGAHLFYWLYHTTSPQGTQNAPLVMWLQGGPGQSSTGMGNFLEIGPKDLSLKPRNTSWLSEASLLFVDSPVGAGYSYVESDSLYCTSTPQIAADMITFLKVFFKSTNGREFQTVPFYIMTESYGGKMTAVIADQLNQAIADGSVTCTFVGVTLGAPFIHPVKTAQSYVNYTLANALIDGDEAKKLTDLYKKLEVSATNQDWKSAFKFLSRMLGNLQKFTNFVNFYNFLRWNKKTFNNVDVFFKGMIDSPEEDTLWALMNGKIRNKLKIIPTDVIWGGQNNSVYDQLKTDIPRPVVNTVNKLVSQTKLQVAVYTSQLDIIVNTLGTLKWVEMLKIYNDFSLAKRQPFTCPLTSNTCGFEKTHDNFSLFWIMNAGHMMPKDNGAAGLEMLKRIFNNRGIGHRK